MSPPEAAVAWAGNVVNGVRIRVMISVVCDPGTGRTGAVEHRKENENLLYNRIELYGTMGKSAVIADGGAETAGGSHSKSGKEDFPAR